MNGERRLLRGVAAAALYAAAFVGVRLAYPARPFVYAPSPPADPHRDYASQEVLVAPLRELPPRQLRPLARGESDLTVPGRGWPALGSPELTRALALELSASGLFLSARVEPEGAPPRDGALVVSGRVLRASASARPNRRFALELELRAAARRVTGTEPWEFRDDVFWSKTYLREAPESRRLPPELVIAAMLRSLYAEAVKDLAQARLAREKAERDAAEAALALAKAKAAEESLPKPPAEPPLEASAPDSWRFGPGAYAPASDGEN